jgi:hypothetical protein
MSSISIIGTGNMARAIGALAVAGGNTVEVIGRDRSKAADLATTLGGSTTTGEFGAAPATPATPRPTGSPSPLTPRSPRKSPRRLRPAPAW